MTCSAGFLQGDAGAELVVELLDKADLRHAQPGEARHVLRVDGLRDILAADFQALFLGGDHAPGLAEQEEHAGILVRQVRVEVAYAR